jgi:hypothetical protein
MHRGLAAFAAAALLALGVRAPASAQSCESFGSQKEAQQALEQTGDASGMLDPDLNGYACEGAFGVDARKRTPPSMRSARSATTAPWKG